MSVAISALVCVPRLASVIVCAPLFPTVKRDIAVGLRQSLPLHQWSVAITFVPAANRHLRPARSVVSGAPVSRHQFEVARAGQADCRSKEPW